MKKIIFGLMALFMFAGISYSTLFSVKTTVGFELSEVVTLNSANAEGCEDDEMEICMKTTCEDGSECECAACIIGTTDCTPDCPCDC